VAVQPLASAESFWQQNGGAVQTLLVYAVAVTAYVLAVNAFYQLVSRRVMFAGRYKKHRLGRTKDMSFGTYFLVFPLVSFAYFLMLAMSILFLGDPAQSVQLSLTSAMAVVLSVRASAYVNEATSHDLAKILPLGLLGVLLVRAQVLDVVESFERLAEVGSQWQLVSVYFGVVVIFEYVAKGLHVVLQKLAHTKRSSP
jgi:hypothetical protein